MTKAYALQLTKGWHDLHDEANCEEFAGCDGAAERLRNDALTDEKKLRAAGYDVNDLWREIEATRKSEERERNARLDRETAKGAARHLARIKHK